MTDPNVQELIRKGLSPVLLENAMVSRDLPNLCAQFGISRRTADALVDRWGIPRGQWRECRQ